MLLRVFWQKEIHESINHLPGASRLAETQISTLEDQPHTQSSFEEDDIPKSPIMF